MADTLVIRSRDHLAQLLVEIVHDAINALDSAAVAGRMARVVNADYSKLCSEAKEA